MSLFLPVLLLSCYSCFCNNGFSVAKLLFLQKPKNKLTANAHSGKNIIQSNTPIQNTHKDIHKNI